MRLSWYSVAYRTEAGARRELRLEAPGRFECMDGRFELAFQTDEIRLSITPYVPLLLEDVQVRLTHPFGRQSRVLMNGYQSWTTTEWLSPRSRMVGLDHVPNALVSRYSIDGAGDYRFSEYDTKPGRFHGYTYCCVREEGVFWLIGSLGEDRGFTLVRTDCENGKVTLLPEPPATWLIPGVEEVLLRAALVARPHEGQAYDRWFALAGIMPRTRVRLAGYSSWYRRYENIDEVAVLSDLSATARVMGGVDVPGVRRVFQVDDGWCLKGDWDTPYAARFPRGMAPIASQARSDGFMPGLWMAPFVCERASRLFAEHPDWLLRDETGEPVRTGSHWSGAYALDVLNPAVREHVRQSVSRAVHEWGYGLLKLDFLYAACLVPHNGMNRGQLMASAWELLRQAAGEECLIDACGVPLGTVFGKTDFCRVGCDVGLDWNDKLAMRLLHRERVSTKASLGNTLSRAPLDGRAFGCDPDVVFLRSGDVRLTDEQKERLISTDAACGSMLLTSDDMDAWTPDAAMRFARAVRQMAARP